MSSTRKINGVSIQLGNRKWRFTEEKGAPMATEERATLIIGGKALTEEEVRALVRDLMDSQDSADTANGYPNAVCDWAGILNKHGITLP